MTLLSLILMAAGTLTGLLAGLLYAFSIAVIPGLRQLSAREHLRAMQAINIRIVNPLFMLSFLGPAVLLPLAAFVSQSSAQVLLIAASALHIVGVIGVTGAGNVPLNNRLARIDSGAISDAEAERARAEYHGVGSAWMRLHHLRTLAAIAATVLVIAASLISRSAE